MALSKSEVQRRYRQNNPGVHKRPQYAASRKKSVKNWTEKNPEKKKRLTQAGHLKKYGLTVEQYDLMLGQQNGVCAICRKPDPMHRLCVDHDHATGKVRGLLCGKCNRGIGYLCDDPMHLRAAADYLERSK